MPAPTIAVVQIGNSDDKLTQEEWSQFCASTHSTVFSRAYQQRIHFYGFAPSDAPWQNACWVFELSTNPEVTSDLHNALAVVARNYRQDSIALTIGETTFVKAKA